MINSSGMLMVHSSRLPVSFIREFTETLVIFPVLVLVYLNVNCSGGTFDYVPNHLRTVPELFFSKI
uniref:Uncharacterized protein n=1 Tax=Arundo donax TaxID=35708 RepID=A0A0A9A1Y0_ARUDO